MPIQGITDGYGAVAGSVSREISEVGKLDFMTLLVAQIKNQDPMSPMDNAEFTGQITQFTMLEELQAMTEKMDENLMMSASLNNTAMLGLVGKNVTVEGDRLEVEDGQVSSNVLACDGPGTAEIEILNEDGNVVQTIRQTVKQGLNDITWNGFLEDENLAQDGQYTMRVSVSNQEIPVNAMTLMTGPVEGLRYDNNVGVVTIGGEEFFVSEIYQIS
ncbi:MAG: flagellar hook assembly protein FlgD [Gemmatimonadales bacterium]|nr:flagellar hook assembly protein FlgD [Gemmatimonadales bacterium]